MFTLDEIAEKFIGLCVDHLDLEQISLKPIRDRQDTSLIDSIIGEVNEELDRTRSALIKNENFYLGSVDFMISRTAGKKEFFILETNGGSSRGFSIMDIKNWERAYEGVFVALPAGKAEVTIVVSYPDKDLLLYEKIFMAEHLKKRSTESGFRSRVIHVNKWLEQDKDDRHPSGNEALIICGGYADLIEHIHLKEGRILLNDLPIDLIVGDGLTRRHPLISKAYLDRATSIKTKVVNPIFHITDDKSMTYHAVVCASEMLRSRRVTPIKYWRAFNHKQFLEMSRDALSNFTEVVIKPHGGSGGSGIDLLTDADKIEDRLTESIEHFGRKFGANRNPFPYTICQRIDATPALWKGSQHHYDVRVYVARDKSDTVRPLGALIRVALEPFTGEFTKKSFVVNLSGYGGVDTSRGLGISEETFKVCGIDRDDVKDLFAASAELMAFMANEYDKITEELRG